MNTINDIDISCCIEYVIRAGNTLLFYYTIHLFSFIMFVYISFVYFVLAKYQDIVSSSPWSILLHSVLIAHCIYSPTKTTSNETDFCSFYPRTWPRSCAFHCKERYIFAIQWCIINHLIKWQMSQNLPSKNEHNFEISIANH
jgi:hypothetical protein